MTTFTESDRQRLLKWVAVDPETGCWNWQGYIVPNDGSGRITIGKKTVNAYRAAYQMLVGPLSSRTHLHHRCENRRCVNPAHLQPTTPAEHNSDLSPNNFAYQHKHKTHCKHGHPLDGDNVKVRFHHGRRLTTRECLTCKRESLKRWYERHRNEKLADNRNWYYARGRYLRRGEQVP